MKFSLWMIADALEHYQPVIYIRREECRSIENVRLFSDKTQKKDSILYIERSDRFFGDLSGRVVCMHGDNYVLLQTEDITSVFNSLLTFFEEKQNWYYDLTTLLSGHCLLKDILNHFRDTLQRPLMVLDASQIVLASSEAFGAGTVDERWDNMLSTGSFGVDVIEKYNQMYQNMISHKEAYLVPSNPFPYANYSRNIFMDNEFIGFISMILKGPELKQSERDWFDAACESVFSWFSLYADNNEIAMRQSMFKSLLNGDFSSAERFLDALNTLGWSKNAPMRLLVLSCISSYLNMSQHIAHIINRTPDTMYAVTLDNFIVVLVNEEQISYGQLLHSLRALLHSSGYYGASSNTFFRLTDLPDQFSLSRIALQHGAAVPGTIHACHDYVLPYVFEVLKQHMKLELCHPAILKLREYDQAHDTGLTDLLYIYLKQECNQTKTAEAVSMHRNSLIRKIAQIRDIADVDLEDYETRFHLLLSYEYARFTS